MPEPILEFLAISGEYGTLKTITAAIHKLGGNLHCASDASSATDFIQRRRIEGIILDMAISDAMDVIRRIRSGSSNRQSVVFVCVDERPQAGPAISAGANFVFHKPLVEETMLQILRAGAPLMAVERRRYFRYEMSAPVQLFLAGALHKATISNLSECGMAVRLAEALPAGTTVEFLFGLPDGPTIKGKGEVIWSNSSGGMGIQFRFLAAAGHRELPQWLSLRDRAAPLSP